MEARFGSDYPCKNEIRFVLKRKEIMMKKFFSILAMTAGLLEFIWAILFFITGNRYGNISFILLLILLFSVVGIKKSEN